MTAHLLEEQRHRVGRLDGELAVGVLGPLDRLAPAVVTHLEAALLKLILDRLSVVLGQLGFLDDVAEVRQGDAPRLTRLGAGRRVPRPCPVSDPSSCADATRFRGLSTRERCNDAA